METLEQLCPSYTWSPCAFGGWVGESSTRILHVVRHRGRWHVNSFTPESWKWVNRR